MLDELLRVGSVKRLRDGRIRLVATAYVPESASAESLEILGSDVSDLIATIDHNLTVAPKRGFFQRKTAYDNLPAEALAEIRALVEREGQRALRPWTARWPSAIATSIPTHGQGAEACDGRRLLLRR